MSVRAITILFLALTLLRAAGPGQAQETGPTEYQLKAAFLWNFAKFVDWPPTTFTNETAPFIIGVLGNSPILRDLEQTVRGKQINAHPIEVRSFRAAADATNSHLLFISASETNRLSETIQSLRGAPVLTVGEYAQFTQSGGMINFVREGNKFRFQIKEDAAKAAGLKISSKLLSLAVRSPAR